MTAGTDDVVAQVAPSLTALIDKAGDDLSVRLVPRVPPPKLASVGRRLVARPTAPAKDLPAVDVAALIEEERKRRPR